MTLLKSISFVAALSIPASVYAAQPAANVRSVDVSQITNDNIYYPESFETDVHKMMENWYIQNYTRLDKDADRKPSVTATDQEYIDRLQRMNTVIEMPYNQIVRSFINMYAERKKGLVEAMLGMSLYYMPIFEQALDRYGMPMELKYLPVIESALNPNAVSKAGATGLWQFMTPTATGLGLEVNSIVDQRRDPYKSSDAAARYLKQLYDTYNDWSLAIAAYNCGPGNVNKALRRAGGGKKDFWEIYRFLPAETRDYIPAFIAANYIMTNFDKHNISPALAAKPIVTDTIHVTRRVHFEQISEVMDIPMDELRILNPQYRTDVIPGDVRPYALVLPNMQVYCYLANEDSIVNHNAEKYARRDVVQPATGSKGKDVKGEYVEEAVVKYHKVLKGETLTSIANRYGVTAASIRKENRIGQKVRRGQTLKITTYKRRYLETPASESAASESTATESAASAATDSVGVTVEAPADSLAAPVAEQAPAEPVQAEPVKTEPKKQEQKKVEPKKAAEPKTVTHTVKSGENLFKISTRYGVSIDAIKAANKLKNDKIQVGQKLVIPAKGTTGGSGSQKKSTRRRR